MRPRDCTPPHWHQRREDFHTLRGAKEVLQDASREGGWFSACRASVLTHWYSSSLAPTLTQWEIESPSFLLIIFQRDGFHILEKDILGVVKLATGSLTSQKSRKEFTIVFYSKCSKKRKIRGQESGRNLTEAEGNRTPSWSPASTVQYDTFLAGQLYTQPNYYCFSLTNSGDELRLGAALLNTVTVKQHTVCFCLPLLIC